MTRRPLFWIVFIALGLGGAGVAVSLFETALPNVSLDISMDREGAMREAAELADRYGWEPSDARSAASFGQVDPEVQTYVELEGGGRDAFQGLMDAGVYQPYQWRVRRFAEGKVGEVEVRFTPSGQPYGFRLQLGEDDPGGGNLREVDARATAEAAVAEWGADLSTYRLLESSNERLPGGRVDHTFVYERDEITLAEARFRLRLVVAGDQLASLTRFVFVPEAFSRRYADMRSTNDAIALVAQGIFILVYVLLGAGVGSALLLKRRWIEWRMALVWGAITATLFGLNAINALPLAWMGYDTAVSARIFVWQNLASAGAIAILGTPILAFFFLAGESLGRKAFPEHLQQWRFWSPKVAASNTALGFTITAYMLVGLQLGYVVLFYLGTGRLEGWWSPADALVQPDLLATYMPWLQGVSISLFASLWEESIFRAVPIACAALIGARFGRRNLWIWGMVVVQAVVFAAGHANYPQQPPYARVVELSFPALAWGAVYVLYGLVPTILAHFLYDLALISSVLFASDALLDQSVIVLVATVPVAVVLWARRGGRATSAPPAEAYNRAWTPPGGPDSGDPGPETGPVGAETEPALPEPSPGEDLANPRLPVPLPAFAALGGVGALLWFGATMIDKLPPRLEHTRVEAEAIALTELQSRGFDLTGWTASVVASGARSEAHEYVLDEAGRAAYDSLYGEFLAPPQWIVRFVDWEAEPEARVEEFIVNIVADGSIRRVAHTLPEARPGPALEEDSARVLARGALPPGSWEEVGAEETAHEARTDWVFTFRSPAALGDVAGEARAAVTVAGAEISNVRRFVHVPEEWERSQREAATRRSMVFLGLAFTLFLLFGVAAVVAVVVWSRGGLEAGPFWKAAALTLVAVTLSGLNGWPATTALFTTSQPLSFQASGAAFGLALVTLLAAAAVGLVAALGHSWSESAGRVRPPRGVGVAVGLAVAGVGSVAAVVAAALPALPDYSGAAAYIPLLAAPLDAVLPFLGLTSAMLVLAVAHRRFRDRGPLRSVTGFAIFAFGVVIVPEALQNMPIAWAGAAVAGVALIWSLVQLIGVLPALAPVVFGTMAVLNALEGLLDAAYPGAMLGHVLAIGVIAALARAWTSELARRPSGR